MKESGSSKLVIGLGNPGMEYENTYHNVGALALTSLANSLIGGESPSWKTHKKLFSYCTGHQESVAWIFVRPAVFMNESGLAAKEALRKFNVAAGDIIVIHDDSDIALGDFKISRDQRSAGHRGVQSIIDHLGTQAFERIKIGIRGKDREARDTNSRQKAGDFVLNHITAKDEEILEMVFGKIAATLQ